MRWILVLCMLSSGCLPDAEAGGPGSRHSQRRSATAGAGSIIASGGVSDPGPLDRYTWDFVFNADGCPAAASSGLPHQVSNTDAGVLAWGYGADAGTYSCNGSTSGLTNLGALTDEAMVFSGTGDNCWNLSSSLFPGIPDGQNMWCRIVFQTGNNSANRYMLSFGSAVADFFGFYQASTERNVFGSRTGGLTALTAQTAVLSLSTWYVLDWVYNGADPTNPSEDSYVNGTATLGSEHSANFGALASGSRIAIGGSSSGQCALSTAQAYTLLTMRCAIGTNAAQFTGESLHDADCTELGACP